MLGKRKRLSVRGNFFILPNKGEKRHARRVFGERNDKKRKKVKKIFDKRK